MVPVCAVGDKILQWLVDIDEAACARVAVAGCPWCGGCHRVFQLNRNQRQEYHCNGCDFRASFDQITGTFFFDYGSAFDDIEAAKFKTGAGGELWFDATFGYVAQFTFRLGYAKGFASGGLDKVYFVAAVPF